MPSSLVAKKRRLQGHVQQGGTFSGLDLRSAQAFQSAWEGVELLKCRAGMSDFRGSRWISCEVDETEVYGANFNAATLHRVTFSHCDMEQASFVGANLRNVDFVQCRLAYGSFAGATLADVRFSDCNLHGTDLDLAESHGVSYERCNLWGVKSAFGCAFWSAKFDEESCRRFAAILARVHPDEEAAMMLRAIAGDNTYKAVCRLMDEPPDSGTPEF